MQHTIAQQITFTGVGLHSGAASVLTLKPAAADTGVMFRRIDVAGAEMVKALYANVVDTRNCTCLADTAGNTISTIEHLMAALSIMKIDNVLVEVTAPEMPIMDGAAAVFFTALRQTGTVEQTAPRRYLKVLKSVRFTDDKGNDVLLEPADKFSVRFEIEFPSKIVGHQVFDAVITPELFAAEIAPCRTFCEKTQIDYLRSMGLIRGGSLDNAVVLDGETILNPGGFKVPNECVNHKVLDALGDMYTAGFPVIGRLTAQKTGHYHNNQVLKALFADKTNYEIIEE